MYFVFIIGFRRSNYVWHKRYHEAADPLGEEIIQ
jgi:hypothetical protein